jgi:hypothetical protein
MRMKKVRNVLIPFLVTFLTFTVDDKRKKDINDKLETKLA